MATMPSPSVQTPSNRYPPNRREIGRLAVTVAAELLSGPRRFECRLVDLSPTGAKIAVVDLPAIFGAATLRLGAAGALRCKLVWRDARYAGLHFLEDPEIVALCVRRLRMT